MDLPYSTEDLPTAFEDGYTSNQQDCRVKIGEYKVTDSGTELVTYGLGSCLGVALYDERNRIAGLIHIKRPLSPRDTQKNKAVFADTGIRTLFNDMQSLGATARYTNATLVGGIDTGGAGSEVNMNIGEKNVDQAQQTLDTLGISVSNTAIGGDEEMSLYFDGASGEVAVETESAGRYRI